MSCQKQISSIAPEKVAYWFFRLNGCLTIVNFIVHPDLIRSDEPRSQRTDVDILAVRFPNRCELLTSGKPMRDHEVFVSLGKIDLIIAEVKHGRCRLNGPWTRSHDKNLHRVLYSIGAFTKGDVSRVADALYRKGYYSNEQFRVRVFAVGAEKNSQLPEGVVQLTWKELLEFIHSRFSQYREHKAQHEQWDMEGKWLYKLSTELSQDKFVSTVLEAIDRF
ncbi:MAG: hypothetical protein HPY70_14460 [Firmicutes bacterium]|nr:hypothetical protein [Bacillota bacterium]